MLITRFARKSRKNLRVAVTGCTRDEFQNRDFGTTPPAQGMPARLKHGRRYEELADAESAFESGTA